MSGGGPGKQKLPPRADPAPTPASISEGADLAGEAEQRAANRRKGRRSLILNEQTLGSTGTQEPKKSLLA
jgi:hypothetical protein